MIDGSRSLSLQVTSPATQLDLLFGHTGETLKRHLEERLGRPVSLVVTENATTMLSVRVRRDVLSVRLHRMFFSAEAPVLDEIVSFLKNRRGAMPRFRKFVRDNAERLRERPARRVTERTSGNHHDLRELYRELNEEYFGGMINAAVTWGVKRPRFAVRKRTLGSYSERSNTIRINPSLDNKTVPRYYVAFVVYHEMLHAAICILQQGKRRTIHSREFRSRERRFKDYARAMAWERGPSSR